MKEYRPALYSSLLLSEKLYSHLLEIDETANARMDILMPQLMKATGVTEELKAANPMKWVGLANACKAQAEELVLTELICCKLRNPDTMYGSVGIFAEYENLYGIFKIAQYAICKIKERT